MEFLGNLSKLLELDLIMGFSENVLDEADLKDLLDHVDAYPIQKHCL